MKARIAGFCCLLALTLMPAFAARADDWPQWRGPQRDGVWRETGLRETLPQGQIPIRWRVPIGSGYSAPTVANGRVYVSDRERDADVERIHCFDWETGEKIWSHEYACSYEGISYDAGPRCAVLIHNNRAYMLGATGFLHCFDAATGEVLWRHDLRTEYIIRMPIWGIAASPIVEGDLLIVPVSGTNAYMVAFDLQTGEEKWKALSDRGNYAAPIIVDQAGKRVVIAWTGDRVVGLDAASGTLHWEYPFGSKRMPLGIATPVIDAQGHLFLTGFYDGCVLLQLDQDKLRVDELWTRLGPNEIRTDGLQSIMATPIIDGEYIYGVDGYGQLRCLQLSDGERVWEDLTAVPKARWANIHMVKNGRRTWMFNERGELIIAELTPGGFNEISRTQLISPTREQLNQRGGVCWSHPAFAYRHVFARNDEELVCADLSAQAVSRPGEGEPDAELADGGAAATIPPVRAAR